MTGGAGDGNRGNGKPPSDPARHPGGGPPEDRTVFMPITAPPQPLGDASWGPTPSQPPAEPAGRHIQVGDVLNHIFEVRRFIARGGMGEVFEGININSDERVAIKVILPDLAADPTVQAMFRKEARTLTRLSHPGLMQYRVLAQEPQLGALYIVTEYIDGINLSDQFATLDPTPGQLIGLLRRLAQGLAVAHSLGAIHRDISPDNIMLEGNQIERAKIIDFGIAKDLDPAGQTIVGDGFAGKLNYVAPEQLGDFDREVGPWTDVYSLGLTMLAVILKRDVDMGSTLVDAVDKRRAGLDVSAAPRLLQPVLAQMLRANPAERPRSMEAVLALLDHPGPIAATDAGETATAAGLSTRAGLAPRTLALIGGGAALAIAAVFAWTVMRGDGAQPGQAAVGGAPASEAAVPPPADPVATARRVVEASFHDMPCSWLTLTNVEAPEGKVSVDLRGVSGQSAEALDRIEGLLRRSGIKASSIDFSDVSPISASMCRPIEAFNQIRADGAGRLDVAQRSFEMNVLPQDAGTDAGRLGAQAVFNLNLAGLSQEMSLIGLDEAGQIAQITTTKEGLMAEAEELGQGQYRFMLNTTHSGWSGILMLTGNPPFDANLTSTSKSRGADWADSFLKRAKERGWKAEMVWYRTVDDLPNSR